MGKFLKGNQLNAELEKLFDEAEDFVVLVSPYIKLHSRFIDALKSKLDKPDFEITIVFGKNENDFNKSIDHENVVFLKSFPNIEIRYEKRLHAKYYANESMAILSSMNLYDYSQNNNIEFGILTKPGSFVKDELDSKAYDYFEEVIKNSELLFKAEPQFESKLLGLSQKYIKSEIIVDKFKDEVKIDNSKPDIQESHNIGFCIRTGEKIPFNPSKPLSDSAYSVWLKFEDPVYPERYCHFSGEESDGETCYSKPILRKNWSKAKPFI